MTALLRLEDARASLASGQVHGHLEVYAADQASTVTVDGQAQPLESDLTAALASTLDKSPLHAIEIAALLRGGTIARQLPRDRTQDGLFMLQPYRPGAIPVVLVHGTASSPARWAELINELEGIRGSGSSSRSGSFSTTRGTPLATRRGGCGRP